MTSPEGGRSLLSQQQVSESTDLFEMGAGRYISVSMLKKMLPDTETALFFAKVYKLSYRQLSQLLAKVRDTTVVEALLGEGANHSQELQDYLVETVPDYVVEPGMLNFTGAPPPAEVLPQLWEQLEVEVAESIQAVADKLAGVLDAMPSKYGEMTFQHLRKLNVQRGSIGTYGAVIQHKQLAPRLVILDVSGSMSEGTIRRIVNEVVALAYKADASLAIVSENTYYWDAGAFSTADVLHAAEYSGTHYETLAPLLDRSWETVITIADYDSSMSAKTMLANRRGTIEQVLDISLVDRPTFLSECVGQRSKAVKPLLIGNDYRVMR